MSREGSSARRYNAGASVQDLADANLISYSAMRRRLLEQGTTMRRPGLPTKASESKSHESFVVLAYREEDKHHLIQQAKLYREEREEYRMAYAKLRTQSEAKIATLTEERRVLEVRLEDAHHQLESALEKVRDLKLLLRMKGN